MTNKLPRFVCDGLRWAESDSERWPKGQPPEALAFQIALTMTEEWPIDITLDRLTAELIDRYASDLALTIHLNDLAEF